EARQCLLFHVLWVPGLGMLAGGRETIMAGPIWHCLTLMRYGSEIKTARLRLRVLTSADAPRLAEIGADWDIASMTSRMPYPYSEAAADQWINGIEPNEVVLGITYDGELIGVTGYLPETDGRSAEIGYWLGRAY